MGSRSAWKMELLHEGLCLVAVRVKQFLRHWEKEQEEEKRGPLLFAGMRDAERIVGIGEAGGAAEVVLRVPGLERLAEQTFPTRASHPSR